MNDENEVSNNSYKVYMQVSAGEISINDDLFSKIYEILPDIDIFEDNRIILGKTLLSGLKYVEPNFGYYVTDENRFLEKPKDFKPRVLPGTKLDKALDNAKDIQNLVNDLTGHYFVALRSIKFLLEREHMLVKKNNKLCENYASVLKQCSDLQNKLELNSLQTKDLMVTKDSYLAFTEEELKQKKQQKEDILKLENEVADYNHYDTNIDKEEVVNEIKDKERKNKKVKESEENIDEIQLPFED